MKDVVWMCGVSLALCVLLGICSVSNAQAMPAPPGGAMVQPVESSPAPAERVGQKRPPGSGKQGQSIPKPERNRFAEMTRNTGGGSRQRTSRQKHSAQAKRASAAGTDESDGSSAIKKTGRAPQVSGVKADRIHDIPLLLAAMSTMGLQQIVDQHLPVQRHQRA